VDCFLTKWESFPLGLELEMKGVMGNNGMRKKIKLWDGAIRLCGMRDGEQVVRLGYVAFLHAPNMRDQLKYLAYKVSHY
jgi:hypothetical protein